MGEKERIVTPQGRYEETSNELSTLMPEDVEKRWQRAY